MSYSIDVNLLLYGSNEASPHHDKAREFLRSKLSQAEILYLSWPTIMAYLRISTHSRIFQTPLSPAEALTNIRRLLAHPRVRALSELDGFLDAYAEVTSEFPVRANLVPDAHLAAILYQHGVRTIFTNDSDFRKFTFLRVINPLLTP